MGAWSGQGRGRSLWVKQLWEGTSIDSPLGDWVGSLGGHGGLRAREELGSRWGLWRFCLTPFLVTALWWLLLPQGLARLSLIIVGEGAPSLEPHSGFRGGSRADG